MCQQHVHTVHLPMQRNAEWRSDLLLTADWHWDNPLCQRNLLKRHLDEAVERQARVFVFGDLFCLMNGKYDPRRSLGKVRPEHKVDHYLDAVVDDCAEWCRPYADVLELITPGNHESAVLKTTGTDPSARLAKALGCAHGTFQGWVRLLFQADPGNFRQGVRLKYHHGHGGGGVVTKGTLWPTRRAAVWPDADIFVSGHIHEHWCFPVTRERLNDRGVINRDNQLHLQTATYKDETSEGDGWAIERGMLPKPLGSWWVHLTYNHTDNRIRWAEERAA